VKLPAKRFEQELIQGWLHEPATPTGDGLVITHGAGSNCETVLLKAVAEAFADAGYVVLRCDLAFRQERPKGSPHPARSARDRDGLRRAVEELRKIAPARVCLGGHSYGGRQSTMLAAEQPGLADALMLLSYPLHPPKQPDRLRTEHFPNLRPPALFIHGTRDDFGSIDEMRAALKLIPGRTQLVTIEGAAHGLKAGIAETCVQALASLMG
jgi:predicted alpha/beta-hydrolase family hydrolase